MSIYKEGFSIIGQLQNDQVQLNELGRFIWVTPIKKGEDYWNMLKQLCDSYSVKNTRRAEKGCVRCNISLINEGKYSDLLDCNYSQEKALACSEQVWRVTYRSKDYVRGNYAKLVHAGHPVFLDEYDGFAQFEVLQDGRTLYENQ